MVVFGFENLQEARADCRAVRERMGEGVCKSR